MGNTDMKKEETKKLTRSALRRQREKEQRFQTILDAAESLFARSGYHQTSIEQIADMAEVSVGTVYFYFKNKDDLLVKLLEEIGFRLRSMIGAAFKESGGTMEGFKQAGYVFFEDFCGNFPEKATILYRESVGQGEAVEACRKKIIEKMTDDVKSALIQSSEKMKLRFKSNASADVIAVSIVGIYERMAYQYLLWNKRPEDLKTFGREAVAFIIGGINNLVNDGQPCT